MERFRQAVVEDLSSQKRPDARMKEGYRDEE